MTPHAGRTKGQGSRPLSLSVPFFLPLPLGTCPLNVRDMSPSRKSESDAHAPHSDLDLPKPIRSDRRQSRQSPFGRSRHGGEEATGAHRGGVDRGAHQAGISAAGYGDSRATGRTYPETSAANLPELIGQLPQPPAPLLRRPTPWPPGARQTPPCTLRAIGLISLANDGWPAALARCAP